MIQQAFAYKNEQPFALLALGVDNLMSLEELFGEKMASDIVENLAQRLLSVVPRIGAIQQTAYKRLLVLLPGFDDVAVRGLVSQIQAVAAAEPIHTSNGSVAVTVSVGCTFGTVGQTAEQHQAPCLHALHTAMEGGVGGFHLAKDDQALLEYRSQLMSLSRATVGALGTDHLTIAFQPVVRASGSHIISFHECLVRLRQGDKSLLTAAEFIPAIERLGLASLIDRQVLGLTLTALEQHPLARFSINIFPQTMQDQAWLRTFENAVAEDEAIGERLIVEVTETAALLETSRTHQFMERLRNHGVTFALDDFGAGHTSLRHLREFRFDILKIDGRFIREIDSEPDNAFLVGALVQIAERFDMMSVAEAVQTPAEARCLQNLGVEYFQGFQFGSPSLKLEPTPTPMPVVAAQA